jgi:hypothetical protein
VHYTSLLGDRVQLDLVGEETIPTVEVDAPMRLSVEEQGSPVVRAAQAHFGAAVPEPSGRAGLPALPLFRERETGLLRTVYRELVVRFNSEVGDRKRRSILAKHKLQVRRTNAFVADQVVVADRSRRVAGAGLLDVANDLAEMEEVRVASANFVSEYRRGGGDRHSRRTVAPAQPRAGRTEEGRGRERTRSVEGLPR